MKTTVSILFAAALTLPLGLASVPAHAVVLDLSTMTCKQFVDGGDDTIKMVLTWMDGWYKGDSDEAIIDTDVFVENAKKFGTYCGKNPTMSIVNAAEIGARQVRPSRFKRSKTNYSIANALETIATGLLSVALVSVTRPKLMVRPRRTTRASASTSEAVTARMKCVV